MDNNLSRIVLAKYLFIITGIALLSSCSDTNKHREITFKAKNGLKVKITCIIKNGDTIYDGIGRYYYNNGVISDEVIYVDNKKDGFHIHYDSNGKLVSKIMYKNNLANGIGSFFSKEGNIEVESFYLNDKLFFSKWFYPNGNIKQYVAVNDSLPFYIISLDTLGRKIVEKGYTFSLSQSCFSMILDSVIVNKPLRAIIPVAAIPGYSTEIQIAKFDSSGAMIGESDSVAVYKYFADYKTIFTRLGKFRLGVAGKLKNEDGSIIRNDTLLVYINVISGE
jgi:hypothetical protein